MELDLVLGRGGYQHDAPTEQTFVRANPRLRVWARFLVEGAARAVQFQQLLVLCDSILLALSQGERASLLRGGDGFGETALLDGRGPGGGAAAREFYRREPGERSGVGGPGVLGRNHFR